ncbi:hypothetical protein AVEN_93451-1 [Araneus ventricosus]|uniref:HTH psq-type domain-containing protein n=1 Tax=Araneus ventricosus TaxID=182803 RepID=A0A4Y2AR45_ARAVE|nr:hypothetical protein AVEN_93451-1 [Araneus ventricosus]
MAGVIQEVLEGHMGYRTAYKAYGIPQTSLERKVKEARQKKLSSEAAAGKMLGRLKKAKKKKTEEQVTSSDEEQESDDACIFCNDCIQIQKTERSGFSVTDVEVGHIKPVQVQKKAKYVINSRLPHIALDFQDKSQNTTLAEPLILYNSQFANLFRQVASIATHAINVTGEQLAAEGG